MPAEERSHGRDVYSDYIAQQVTREDERKTSLETRGLAVVTTSGALATLLLGLATLTNSTTDGPFVLPRSSYGWIESALVLFTVAAVSAIATNSPFFYKAADLAGLEALLPTAFDNDSYAEATREVATNRIAILKRAKLWNGLKGWLLFLSMLCEVAAVACIAVAVWHALEGKTVHSHSKHGMTRSPMIVSH